MELQDGLRILLTGVSYGMILFLIASGLSLILGVMGILNLAHGSLYMLGAYLGLAILPVVNNFWVAAAVSGLAVGLIGLILERGFLRRLYKRFNDQVLLTLGFVYIFGNGALWIWGSFPKLGEVPPEFDYSIPMGSLDFPVFRLVLIGIGLGVAALLWYLQNRTRVGAVVRAGMDDREMVLGLGINYGLVSTGVFFLGVVISGIAGFLGSPLRGASWDMGFPILIQALIVVVVGGVGRVEGTLVGAILIGLIDSFGKILLPEFSLFTIYVVFILILLFKPSGLLGRVRFGTAAAPSTDFRAEARGIPRDFRYPWQKTLIAAAPYLLIVAFLFALPTFAAPYLRSTTVQVMIFAIFALSLNLLFGYTGMFSLGHAAFFGVGAYTTALLFTRMDITSLWVLLPAGALMGALFAALFGVIALRVQGMYFLFVTLALGELLAAAANNWTELTGGSNGIFGIGYPSIGFDVRIRAPEYFYIVLIVFLVCAAALYAIKRSAFGLALQGIRDDEGRMKHLGYNTWAFKYAAFVISGAFAGIAGVLFAPSVGTVVPGYLGAQTAAIVMLMIIIGSSRLFGGPIVGAAVVTFLQYYVSLWAPARWPLILGVIFVLSVLVLPGGMGIYVSRALRWLTTRRAARQPVAVPAPALAEQVREA
ncbi:MAG: ABC transporter permease [bacterium]|nr:ABC transporter permease [bacterium]